MISNTYLLNSISGNTFFKNKFYKIKFSLFFCSTGTPEVFSARNKLDGLLQGLVDKTEER